MQLSRQVTAEAQRTLQQRTVLQFKPMLMSISSHHLWETYEPSDRERCNVTDLPLSLGALIACDIYF
jgi:hypothetical protein